MAERAIATCVEILFLTGLGALIAKSLPPPLELDVKKTRKEKNESWKKQSGRAAEERKKERGGRSRVIQFNVRARRHHLSRAHQVYYINKKFV